MKNVTFITTGQPATNPRLVKEAETLIGLGYNVKVICCFYHQWAVTFDKEISDKYPGTYLYCGGDPIHQRLSYMMTRLRQKLSQLMWFRVGLDRLAETAISRTHRESLKIAKQIKSDIYIAHNLGALPAAVAAAEHSGAKVGYDAEDMHSGQFNSENDRMYLLNKFIEEKYFKETDYFSVASPLIGENYRLKYPFLDPVVINNVFPRTDIVWQPARPFNDPIKLFWFSQTIGGERGLELIIRAISLASNRPELHLLGNCSEGDRAAFLTLALQYGLDSSQLQFHAPVAPDQLPAFTARFDVGMASETGTTLNRDICLTNKIFTYVQSGLPILASNTSAQALFLQFYPQTGKLYPKDDENALSLLINAYDQDREGLEHTRRFNYLLGQKELNWETESRLFINLIKDTLQKVE